MKTLAVMFSLFLGVDHQDIPVPGTLTKLVRVVDGSVTCYVLYESFMYKKPVGVSCLQVHQ